MPCLLGRLGRSAKPYLNYGTTSYLHVKDTPTVGEDGMARHIDDLNPRQYLKDLYEKRGNEMQTKGGS